jgi:hypothetical protein
MVKMMVLGWQNGLEGAVWARKPPELAFDHGFCLASELSASCLDSCVQLLVVNLLFLSKIVWVGIGL